MTTLLQTPAARESFAAQARTTPGEGAGQVYTDAPTTETQPSARVSVTRPIAHTMTDRTPAGYGPTQLTNEQRARVNAMLTVAHARAAIIHARAAIIHATAGRSPQARAAIVRAARSSQRAHELGPNSPAAARAGLEYMVAAHYLATCSRYRPAQSAPD